MSHSPVNNCSITVTLSEITHQDKFSCTRLAHLPHPTEPIFLAVQIKAFGQLAEELQQLESDVPFLCLGEIHVSHDESRKREWTLFPYAIIPCTQAINVVTITGRFGTLYREAGYSSSRDSSWLKDKLAVPAHHSQLDRNNKDNPCNRTWIPVTAFDKMADLISHHASKGNLSSVSGSLTFRLKNEVLYSEIEVSRIQLLHSPKHESSQEVSQVAVPA